MAHWGPFEWARRAITLPSSHNSLSDIARDPLGAVVKALPAVGVATGMGWLKVPGLPSGFLKGGLGKISLGSVGQWIQKNPEMAALIGISLLNAYQSGQARRGAEGAMGDVQRLYAQLFAQSLPFASALTQARLDALADALNQPDVGIAQARRALDAQLANLDRRQALSGLRSLSADRLRAQAISNFATQVAALRNAAPWQRLSLLLGAGRGYDAGALAGLTGLTQQRLLSASAQENQMLSALATLLPHILEEI